MCRIGGSLRSGVARHRGGVVEIPPFVSWDSNPHPSSGAETVPGGQFDWGGSLLKCNGGALRYPQRGRQSRNECKGKRVLDCKTDKSSRCESRA